MNRTQMAVRWAAIVVFASFSTVFAAEPTVATWTQWRGPNRDSRIQAPAWPTTLAAGKLSGHWKVKLGPSYSGPIVTQDLVFVTETKNAKYEVVRALDRTTGKEVWNQQWAGAMRVPFFAKANGDWIRATPAYNGERLYVAGIRDVLVCLDVKTGEIVWKLDFVKETGSRLPQFGCASSPLVVGDHVYIQAGGAFVKLDKKTGKIIWRTLRDGGGMYGSAFSSPVISELHGKRQLIVQTRSKLAGVDIKDGKELWSKKVAAFRGMNILTPTITNNRLFTSSYGGGSFMFDAVKGGDKMNLETAWNTKTQGYMSSPVVIGKHAYLHLRNQRFCCIDLETGKTTWTTKPFGKYWSMVANGNQILALDERGDLLLINANPKRFELVDRREVSNRSTWAHLAVCGNEVYVRDLAGLQVFQWNLPQTTATSSEN